MRRLLRKKEHPVLVFAKYALVGAVAASAELTLLHTLTNHTALWYVYCSALSSIVSFIIGFILRKLWVFEDPTWSDVPRQASLYLLSLVLVVGTNTLLMSFLVEHYGFPYLPAQFSAGIITGLIGFVINRKFTFGHLLQR